MDVDAQIDNDNVLCYLNDWTKRVASTARTTNESVNSRFAISALTYSWALVEFRSNGSQMYHKYATCLKDLCAWFRISAGLDIENSLNRICEALAEKMHTESKLNLQSQSKFDILGLLEMADRIDNHYKLNYATHDSIRERIFAENKNES